MSIGHEEKMQNIHLFLCDNVSCAVITHSIFSAQNFLQHYLLLFNVYD
ncbi:hypothetical protein Krac_6583 [Ktedonobacter racemifer DSM 44963]|uniref:Uncharacterized protein n=1 Tax=Ktedonobacter racemifer DSM 44963 TaxID=485913 RepID=D6TVG9_KTERA|nr:hypothetical protein Krac_6583 [Ktedonobacter racemifer DSM 44963]